MLRLRLRWPLLLDAVLPVGELAALLLAEREEEAPPLKRSGVREKKDCVWLARDVNCWCPLPLLPEAAWLSSARVVVANEKGTALVRGARAVWEPSPWQPLLRARALEA